MRMLIVSAVLGSVVTTAAAGQPPGEIPARPRAGPAITATATAGGAASTAARPSFGWPLAGFPGVARRFEPPAHWYGQGHRGVDLVGAPGQEVLAAGDGTVVFAGPVAGRPVISVDHPGGLRTTYEPVRATVTVGQRVRRGTALGTLAAGHPGCPAPACLHWGVRRGTEYLDPLWLLAPGRVRLLPDDP